MTSTTLAAAELLDATADTIETYGWTRFAYHNPSGVCLMGGLAKTRFNDASYFSVISGQAMAKSSRMSLSMSEWFDYLRTFDSVLHEALVAFDAHIADEARAFARQQGVPDNEELFLTYWNDNVATSGAEVVEKLRAVALVLRAKEETPVEEKELVTA